MSEARPAGCRRAWMSVPRPAMFVAIVTAPVRPAWATIPDSFSWNLALRTSCLMPLPIEHLAESLRLLDRHRADEDRPSGRLHLLDLVDDGVELRLLVEVDEVRVVLADHRHVGRDRDDLELVDLVELLGLGHRRSGHAGELVVQAEVVLERDRGHRHALALDPQALLGLDRLVQALAPAAARHLAAR